MNRSKRNVSLSFVFSEDPNEDLSSEHVNVNTNYTITPGLLEGLGVFTEH